jgi:hypothetical protein
MSEEKLDKLIVLLEDVRKWTRFQGWISVKEVLVDTLKTDEEKLVYHHSDGCSSRAVASSTPVSQSTVLKMWEKWAKIGIVEPIQVQRGTRYQKIFSLEEFNIEVPETPPTNSASNNKNVVLQEGDDE